MKISSLFRKYTPYFIRKALNKLFAYKSNTRRKQKWNTYRNTILNYYTSNPQLIQRNLEIAEAVDYLRNHEMFFYPYKVADDYLKRKFNVIWDDSKSMYYTMIDGDKKMYLNKSRDRFHHENYCKSIFMEQDFQSPHRYLTNDFDVALGSTIIDAGGAEGLFTLLVVDKIKKAYIIEPDQGWVEALKATFAPWKDKIEIIPKFISDKSDNNSITIDSLYGKDKNISFLKADIEGFELRALQGAPIFLKNSKEAKLLICTYHKEEDEIVLADFISNYGFTYSFSDKYMVPLNEPPEKFNPPYFRKVLFRAKK